MTFENCSSSLFRVPVLTITNRQRRIPLDLARIRGLVDLALPACLAERGPTPAVLPDLPAVDVAILAPRAMAAVHRQFLGIRGATDVITFPYGEILVCAEIAAHQAADFGHSTDEEVALYIIHGLLHLNGFDDTTPDFAAQMHARQANLLNAARIQL